MLPRVKWVVDQLMIDRAPPTGRPLLADALREEGFEVVVSRFEPGSREPDQAIPRWKDECVVCHGGMPFLRQLLRDRGSDWQPGAFFRIDRLAYSAFGAHLGDLLLNDRFVILPFGEFRRRGIDSFGGRAFLRPDAVTKSFSGLEISRDNWDVEIATLLQISHVFPEDLVVVAPPREILGESRFVIADGKVVTGSTYSWNGVLDVRSDVHPLCNEIATIVAGRSWQADRVYTCDVALARIDGREQARLLELNAFSSSGLYACDTRRIAEAVSRSALREFLGD